MASAYQKANSTKRSFYLNEEDAKRTKLEALRRSLQLTDRIMSGREEVRLRFSDRRPEDGNGHPGSGLGHSYAITAGNDITINVNEIPDATSNRGIANILGLNYHELAHVLLTPADRSIISNAQRYTEYKGVQLSQNFWPAFSILEEARVETLLGAKYPSLRKYFSYPVLSLMVAGTTSFDMNTRHLLLHGRRYLPKNIRDSFREFFEKAYNEADARSAESYIDEYRFISFTQDSAYAKAATCIQKFALLLDKLGITPPTPEHGGGVGEQQSLGAPNSGKQKKSDTRQDQENMAKAAKEESDKQDKEESQQEGGESEDGDSEPGEGKSDQNSGSGSDREKGGQDSSGSNDREPDRKEQPDKGRGKKSRPLEGADNSPSPNGPTAGSGSGGDPIKKSAPKPDTFSRFKIAKALEDHLEELLDDNEVNEEIQRYQSAMEGSDDGLTSVLGLTPEKSEKHLRPVTVDMFNRSGLVADQLRQLWAKMEPGWNYGVEDGPRLNMMNAAMASSAEDYENIWDDWSAGQQENSGIEVVIMGDRSGSMISYLLANGITSYELNRMSKEELENIPSLANVVSKNIWEFMYALQEVEAKVTVLTYDGYCYTFYNRTETVNGNGWYELEGAGSTDPTLAFQETRRILSQSEMPNKLLINFTDGGWGSHYESIKECVDSLHDTVKVAALIGTFTPDQFRYRDLFDIVENTSGDILNIISSAVIQIIHRSAGI